MIASVAGFDPLRIPQVAAQSYALTLWAFLQGKDARRLEELTREAESIDLAEMIACGYHEPKKIALIRNQFRAKLSAPVEPATLEELSKWADELHELHDRGSRLVS